MEAAQAGGQAPAQAPQQAHPIHQETATLNALTEWVRNTPDNDPHAGTDMEAPKPPQQEAKPEEPKEEAQAEEPQGETIEIPEDEPLFDVELKTEIGKEQKKLSLKEMRDGYLRMQDYHRNIQKVKQQESELQQRVQQATLQAQQEYVQRLEMQKQAVSRLAGVKPMQEIEQLAREDPAAAQQEFLRLISVNQTMQQIEAEQRQAQQSLQAQQQAAMQAAIQKARETLESDIPGWNGEVYQKTLETVSKEYGFEPKDVASVYDSRLIKVFHDAAKYRQLQQAKPEVSKKVVAVPKVIKPGSAEKPNPAKDQAARFHDRLKKTGRVEDAVSAYLSRQKK